MIYKTMWNVYKRWLKASAHLAEAAASKAANKGAEDAALNYRLESDILLGQLNTMNQIEEEFNA